MSLNKPFGLALALSAFVAARMMVRRDSFAGKVVVITGGSRGLGLALARRLAQENGKLAILARDQQELLRAKIDLEKYAATVTTWVCDVKNETDVRSTIEEVATVLGGVDLLINNAGEIVVGPLEAMKREDFQNAFVDILFLGSRILWRAELSSKKYLRHDRGTWLAKDRISQERLL